MQGPWYQPQLGADGCEDGMTGEGVPLLLLVLGEGVSDWRRWKRGQVCVWLGHCVEWSDAVAQGGMVMFLSYCKLGQALEVK